MSGEEEYIGIVENGQLSVLTPDWNSFVPVSPTRMPSKQAAISPEAAAIDIKVYEGKAVMISGRKEDDCIYSAEVIDEAGPIVAALIRRMLPRAKL